MTNASCYDLARYNAGSPVEITQEEAVTAASLGLPVGEFVRYYPHEGRAYHFFRMVDFCPEVGLTGDWEACYVGQPVFRVNLPISQPELLEKALTYFSEKLPLVTILLSKEENQGIFYSYFQEPLGEILQGILEE